MGAFSSKPSLLKTFAWSESDDVGDFDVIIIGSGPAGCVLANRLSEDGKTRVLLVEAGISPEKELYTKIPLTWKENLQSKLDWQNRTTPQGNLNGRQILWSRGKVLGGSSSINAMIYHHGAPSDYDQWEAEGAPGWGYKDLAPYFKKAETYTVDDRHSDVDLTHRGTSGPWQTGFQYAIPVSENWIKAVQALGVPYTPDLNTPNGTLGVTTFSTFVDGKGHRSSGATAYLTPDVLARPNLTVLIETRCTRVLLDGTRAVGVELADERNHGSRKRIYLSPGGEVILSSGAVATPEILMLSGLGPKDELEGLGIECKVDLPAVGQHLQDHLMACLNFRMKPGFSYDWLATSPMRVLPYLAQWMMGWKGLLTSIGAERAAFVRMDDPLWKLEDRTCGEPYHTNANPNGPDIELIAAPATWLENGKFVRPWLNGLTINTVLLQPASRGCVTLKSADPFDPPVVDPKYFSSITDLQAMVRGIRIVLRIARTSPLIDVLDLRQPTSKNPNAKETEEQMAYGFGDWKEEGLSDDDIVTWLRENANTIYHAVGSARMGKSPADSVVDTELRVHGVEGLRVCDASVFPRIISGHTTAPTIAVAEKGADIIRTALGGRKA